MEFEERTKLYYQWLQDSGVKFVKKCTIEDLRHRNTGRGVVAQEPIKSGDTIFEIPRSIILNVDNSSLLDDNPGAKEPLMRLNQWEVLIVLLLNEIKCKGPHSKWKDYFKVLPISDDENYQFNQLMFWNSEELAELNPSLITERIGRDLADGMYKKLFPTYVIDKMGLVELKDTTLEEYHKIASLIMSYSFDIEKLNEQGFVDGEDDDDDDDDDDDENENEKENDDDGDEHEQEDKEDDSHNLDEEKKNGVVGSPGSSSDGEYDNIKNDSFLKSMIPLADTLNADTNKHNASLEYLGDKLVIRAIKDIAVGDQLYNTYSDHPNSEILRRYGYVEQYGSKHDFGEIPMDVIKKHFIKGGSPISDDFFDEILEIFGRISKEEKEEEVVDFVLDSYDCFITGEIIIELVILLQCLTILVSINAINPMVSLSFDSKFQLIRRIYRKCIQLIESRKLTKLCLTNYKAIVNKRLAQYPDLASESFSHDVNMSRSSMAKVVLRSEYKSLKNCLDIDKAFKFDDVTYSFIDDEKLIRNIIKRKFDLPFASTPEKKRRV